MNQTLRSLATGATGALLVAAVVVAQPALADQVDKVVAKNQVTSKSIKNGQVKPKDLAADVNASLDKADSALQSVPDNSVTTAKLADDAVTNPKIADNAVASAEVAANSLTAGDLAADSVAGSELAANSVTSTAVQNGSLNLVDYASASGVEPVDYPAIPAGSCLTDTVATGSNLNDDLILVTAGPTMPGIVSVTGRQQAAGSGTIVFVACNGAGVALNPALTNISWAVVEN